MLTIAFFFGVLSGTEKPESLVRVVSWTARTSEPDNSFSQRGFREKPPWISGKIWSGNRNWRWIVFQELYWRHLVFRINQKNATSLISLPKTMIKKLRKERCFFFFLFSFIIFLFWERKLVREEGNERSRSKRWRGRGAHFSVEEGSVTKMRIIDCDVACLEALISFVARSYVYTTLPWVSILKILGVEEKK